MQRVITLLIRLSALYCVWQFLSFVTILTEFGLAWYSQVEYEQIVYKYPLWTFPVIAVIWLTTGILLWMKAPLISTWIFSGTKR